MADLTYSEARRRILEYLVIFRPQGYYADALYKAMNALDNSVLTLVQERGIKNGKINLFK